MSVFDWLRGLSGGDLVLIFTAALLIVVILFQLWLSAEGDLRLEVCDGTLFFDGRHFSLVGDGNGCANLEPGSWSCAVEWNPRHECEMVRAVGLGWIGGHPDCDVVIGKERGRHAVLADVLTQERLRVLVCDAIADGRRVILKVSACSPDC